MQLRFTQFLTALRQAKTFLDDNASALGTINSTGARKALDDSIAELDAQADRQRAFRTQSMGALAKERQQARMLKRKMRPIARIARVKLPALAEVAEVKMPQGHLNSTALASQAKAMAAAVSPHAEEFHQFGRPADFINQLTAAADDLVKTIAVKGTHRTNRMGATDAITKAVATASRVIGVLDSLVHEHLDEGAPLLANWRGAIQVISPGPLVGAQALAGSAPAPTSPPPAVPSTPPAVEAPVKLAA